MSQTTTSPSPTADSLAQASEETRHQAERLLSQAGSQEQGRQAVDSATGHPAAPSPENDKFAKRWGFGSYLEMFEASKPLTLPSGEHCLVTHVPTSSWIVWDEATLSVVRTVALLDDATQSASAPQQSDADTQPKVADAKSAS